MQISSHNIFQLAGKNKKMCVLHHMKCGEFQKVLQYQTGVKSVYVHPEW